MYARGAAVLRLVVGRAAEIVGRRTHVRILTKQAEGSRIALCELVARPRFRLDLEESQNDVACVDQ